MDDRGAWIRTGGGEIKSQLLGLTSTKRETDRMALTAELHGNRYFSLHALALMVHE